MTTPREPVPVAGPRGRLPGLPAQRTLMAWDRTALALIAHGALLVIKHPGESGPARWVPAVLSLGLALMVAAFGRTRALEIADADRTRYARVPTSQLVAITAGVVALGLADLVAILR
jgi:uncharacterized membrane protein YidH (DUF202 family)